MIKKSVLRKVSEVIWEIPKSFRKDMNVPARIFATEPMLDEILSDRSLEQLVNVATLPGILKHALAMPDIHEGYGFPIGGVAATAHPEGIISPGGIGYDINCGVRLLKSDLIIDDIKPHLQTLGERLFQTIPSGVGRGGKIRLDSVSLDHILGGGVPYIITEGYGDKNDLISTESNGYLANADPAAVSKHAKERGRSQLGTMGAGNHFVEVDEVVEIFDETIAESFGLSKNQVVILIHTGSRGLGHQIATDYIRIMLNNLSKFHLTIVDRELSCAPFSSPEGTNYFNAMAAAANFAWCNRQLITHLTRQTWGVIFGSSAKLKLLYDVTHNIAKIEEHDIDGKLQKVIVHRKGVTRSFPDQPVIIPGSMGTASYVLMGTKEAMEKSFGSTCHGAGRRMSRHEAKRRVAGKSLKAELEKMGIFIQTGSIFGLAEEAPLAYKDIHDVVDLVSKAQIAKKVAKLKPVVVIKG